MVKKTENILENIIAKLPGHIYWKDENGVYLGCNDEQAESLGLKSRHEIVGKTDFDLSWRPDAETFRKNDLDVMKTGKEKTVEEKCVINGKVAIVLSKKVPLRDSKGDIIGILGVSVDISERKKEENKLIAEKELAELTLEHIIAHMPGHVYWKDKDGIYLGCNNKQAKSFGLKSRQDVIGKTDFDLPWKEQASKLREADLRVINNGESITVEEPALLKDGTLATFLSKKEPLRDKNNNIIGILGVSIDITEIKEYQERLKKANQAKSDFLRIMSHELTAPISNVINSLDAIKHLIEINDFDKEAILSYLELAKQEAALVKPKLNDVIDYLNFDEKNVVSHKAGCNLLELLEKVVEKNKPRKSPAVVINYEVDKNLPHRVIVDTEHLYKALNIAISNAIKYTQQGSITIGLATMPAQTQTEDAFIRITVKDTGPGIHAEQLKAILQDSIKMTNEDTYSRYRKPSVRLPYAKLLVQQVLKGDFTIQSKLGEGTSITIEIPYKQASDESAVGKEKVQLTPFQVLLVEDNEVSRRLEGEMLKRLNCVVEEAATGEVAIAKATAKRFDFIFLDITLPDMNGIQVFERLQTTLSSDTPVIALTSHATEEDVDIFTDKGMLTVITKPISLEALQAFFESYKKSLED